MLSAVVVAHPHHAESPARWIAEARSNPKIVGVKLYPALGNYDVVSPDVFRLMDDAVGPSGLPVISHTDNDSPNAPIGRFLPDAPLYLPALFSRLLEALSISEEQKQMIAFRNVLQVVPALAGRPGVVEGAL